MPNVIADVHVSPLGLGSTSVSKYITHCLEVLKDHPNIRHRLNPMSSTLEGELDEVFEVIKKMHQAPFDQGVQRVSTSIRIDDRRDKPDASMEQKMASISHK